MGKRDKPGGASRRTVHRAGFLATLFLAAGGCASLRPVAAGGEAGQRESQDPPVVVDAVQGHAEGLVLSLSWEAVEGVETVELYREGEDGQPELLFRLAPAEARPPLELLDSGVRPGVNAYFAFLVAGGRPVAASRDLHVRWVAPPSAPREVRGRVLGGVAEVEWSADAVDGAAVFRRDVVAGGEFQKVVDRCDGRDERYVDRTVVPGGVWSYRVALCVNPPGGVPQLGALSEEIYVTAEER